MAYGTTTYDTTALREQERRMLDKSAPAFSVGHDTTTQFIDAEKKRVAARDGAVPTSTAAQATGATIGTAGAGYQTEHAARLRALALGGPSAGAQQALAAGEAAKKANYAAAFGKPGGGVRALRGTENQNALMESGTARQAAIIGAQEQAAAQSQYAALSSAMRQGEMLEAAEANRIAMANAGFSQQSAFANQDAALRWQQMNDQQRRAALGMGIDNSQSEWDNKLDYYSLLRQKEMDWQQTRRERDIRDDAATAKWGTTAVSVGMAGKGG